MAFPTKIAKLDDVEEGFRPHYKQGVNGDTHFYVDLTSVDDLPAIQGLKQNKNDLLEEKRVLVNKYKAFETLPADKVAAVAAHVAAGKPLLDQSSWAAQETELRTQFKTELDPLKLENTELTEFMHETLVENQVLMYAKDKAHEPELLLPFLAPSLKVVKVGKRFATRVIDPATGNERIGDTMGTPMSIAQRIDEMAKTPKFRSLFKSTGASGTLEDGVPTNQDGSPSPNVDAGNLPKKADGTVDLNKITDEQKSNLIEKVGLDGYRKAVGL